MIVLDIRPFEGARPILFRSSRDEVRAALGPPPGIESHVDRWGRTAELVVGYDGDGLVNHIGMGPGDLSVSLCGRALWSPGVETDPNVALLALDPDPFEILGFLVFPRIGVTTTGYHDDYPSDQALTVFPEGAWDKYLPRASAPDLSLYRSR